MLQYHYRALNSDGEQTKGQAEADSERQLRQQLREKGLIPIEVRPLSGKQKWLSANSVLKSKLNINEQAMVIGQLHTLLDAGMALAPALKSIVEQVEKRHTQRFVAQVLHSVMEGYPLAMSFEKSGFVMDPTLIATIRAGEESGHLAQVLGRLSEAILEQEKLQKKIQTAMIYPSIMVIMSIAIVFFLMVYVVPKVVTVFDGTGQELPGLTQGLLLLSQWTQQYWEIGAVLFLALFALYRFLMRNDRWVYRKDAFLLRMPFLKKFLITTSVARWSRTLGVLLNSGVTMTDALTIAAKVVTLKPLALKAHKMQINVKEGQALNKAMNEAGFFPGLLKNLVQTGEDSGQLPRMLGKGADHYENEVTTSATVLVSLVEPVMILIMGGVVLTIVLAIMLPIFEMNQMVGG
ncbi:type II secretion system F family protein [Thiomicrospira sp. WB1]|uniref:type II secretion system F family protein n=1 Tax=Thiomicrospira sp. WB1 TaxID=1685380 RepID=UPI0007482AB0|nr:type II secretion system F family protein [Thiomicrospira sp. WB1]KUJ72429.1 type II secretion system protein GspF [Thiomicrospira sp. WB1]